MDRSGLVDEQILDFLQNLQSEIQEIKSCVHALADSQGRRRVLPREYISIGQAAAMLDRTKKAVQRLLERDASNPDGIHPRRIHGGVHAADFQRFIESKKIKGRGAMVNSALDER